jgi:hypothetical protein
MSAAPLLHIPPAAARTEADGPLTRAAATARDRIGELPGVRVLASAHADHMRLAVDVRDTGRDGTKVACALAGRGIPVEASAGRALIVRLRTDDVAAGMHERLAPAILQALWSVRPRHGYELALDPIARRRY